MAFDCDTSENPPRFFSWIFSIFKTIPAVTVWCCDPSFFTDMWETHTKLLQNIQKSYIFYLIMTFSSYIWCLKTKEEIEQPSYSLVWEILWCFIPVCCLLFSVLVMVIHSAFLLYFTFKNSEMNSKFVLGFRKRFLLFFFKLIII